MNSLIAIHKPRFFVDPRMLYVDDVLRALYFVGDELKPKAIFKIQSIMNMREPDDNPYALWDFEFLSKCETLGEQVDFILQVYDL